jgi:ABC-type branched-subunit amino acid transport system ATPase component
VIEDKIYSQLQKENNRICVVGLHGMGGMGKTTICKALCNHFVSKFRGRVCHAELERVSAEELLRNVLRKLSNSRREVLSELSLDEVQSAGPLLILSFDVLMIKYGSEHCF